MSIKFQLIRDVHTPTRGTDGSAGLDFYSPADFIVPAWGDYLLPLGFIVALPPGYTMIIKEKSGIATKKKLHIGACVIDADYRGECHAHFFNHSDVDAVFNTGDRICQGIVIPVCMDLPELCVIDSETKRGAGGFGSTGK